MLTCGCFRRRRSPSFEDSSSCRSSEIERSGQEAATAAATSSILFTMRGWCGQWRKPSRGMSMSKIERTMKAAILIQRWYRRYLARMEVRRRFSWTIFQNLEYAGEQDQLRLYNFFNALLTHIPTSVKKAETNDSTKSSSSEGVDKFSDESDDLADEGISPPEKTTYRGSHINFPLTKKDLDILIDLFRKKKYNRLHPKYVAGILRDARVSLMDQPNLNVVSTSISKQVTICGDLHGKLDDLLVIFHKNGLPSPENPYVFNGDFVDRGRKSLEVFLLLLTCQILYPDGVFLNRGNHEDSVMNTRYGFTREVHQKYKHNAERLLKLIEGVYRWLPLGTIINNRVLVVHGGISDSTDLDLVRSLDRSRFTSLLRPPLAEGNNQGLNDMDRTEWKQVFDMLWSDPQPNEGCRPNSLRGAGTYFGPDVTKSFLEKHKLNFLIRSHECKPEGHETIHNDQVITIFSASNYYEIGSNKGAYLKLDPRLEKHFVQYTAAASKTRKLTFRQRVGLVESSAIRELAAQLRKCRTELEEEFILRDVTQTGFLTLAQWCEAMETATCLGLPWRLLRDRLAPVEPNQPLTTVRYIKTLELLDSDSMKSHPGSVSVAESLYRNKASLEAIFNIMDKDNSGHITLEEFAEACEVLRTHIPEFGTVIDFHRLMDINGDGSVDLNEFLEAFRLCDQSRRGLRLPIDEILKEEDAEVEQNKTADVYTKRASIDGSHANNIRKDESASCENITEEKQDTIEKADNKSEKKTQKSAKTLINDFDGYDLGDSDEDTDFEDPILDENDDHNEKHKKLAPKAIDDEDI